MGGGRSRPGIPRRRRGPTALHLFPRLPAWRLAGRPDHPGALGPLPDGLVAVPIAGKGGSPLVDPALDEEAVARDLARAGKRVMVIEAGALYDERSFPTRERDAYERLYLDSGFTATDDAHIAILAGGTVGGGTTVNWMTSIPVPDRVRAEWEERHGVTGIASPRFKQDLNEVLREVGAQPAESTPPKDAALLRGAAGRGWSP